MAFRDLFLFLEAGAPCEARLGLAVALAEQHGASVSALFAPLDPGLDAADCYAIGPAAVTDALAHREAEICGALSPTRAAFAAAMAGRDIPHRQMISSLGEVAQDLALRARCYDLAIVRRPPDRDHPSHRLAELVALSSGAPCLVTPEEPLASPRFQRILIGWNGGREARRALQDSLPLLKRAQSVRLVVVDGDSGETPSTASREDVLRHLARHDIEASLDCVDAKGRDAGSALLHQCGVFHADLLVMGAYGHSRTKELVLGGATRSVLAHAPLPVFLSH